MRFVKTVLVCGVCPYRIYKAKPPEFQSEDESLEGLTNYDDRKIFISECLDRIRYDEVLQHELRHAWWHESGMGNLFATLTKLKGDKLIAAEETLIRMDTTAGMATLKSAGLPRGRYKGK